MVRLFLLVLMLGQAVLSLPYEDRAEGRDNVRLMELLERALDDLATGENTRDIEGTELSLIGLPAYQSSTLDGSRGSAYAKKVVDGRFDDTKLLGEKGELYGGSCTITNAQENPNWIIRLDKRRCISRVSVLNRGDGDSERLTGAVVRVGNTGVFQMNKNSLCGSPVTAEQAAVPGGTVDFVCDQLPALSDSVIVGIPSPDATLQLCEVRVWELPFERCQRDASLGCTPNPCISAECVPKPDGQAFCECYDGQNGEFCEESSIRIECEPSSDEDRYIYDQYEGYIQSPGYPEPHGIEQRCPYIIGFPGAEKIEIRFEDVDMDFSKSNYLVYQPGDTMDFQSDEKVVLQGLPKESIVVNDDKVSVFFQTSSFNPDNQKGFRMHFKIHIDECASDPCHNAAECVDGVNEFSCTCAPGFTGPLCETDIDECSSSPCQNGVCHDEVNGFSCDCSPGYEGTLCETNMNECGSDPCQNGAECVDGDNEFSCSCAAGFAGPMCETGVDECGSDPCQNGAECVDGINEFSCTCAAGFAGPMCETGVDECGSDPCQNGAECVDGINEFSCTCAAGFTGPMCETGVDECGSDPCQNGAECVDGVNEFACTCAAGFTGPLCETDIDECERDPCQNGAECVDGISEVSCTCAAGFTGTLCETDIDECVSDPCQNGAECADGVNEVSCKCATGFIGPLCETALQEPAKPVQPVTPVEPVEPVIEESNGCTTNPCKNGVCINYGVDGFKCVCSPGYAGTVCEIDIDECSSDPCQNGAECVDGVAKVSCKCAAGYTGRLCEIEQLQGASDARPQLHSTSTGVEVETQTSFMQVNLVTEYCIKKVVVHKRGDCTGARLTGAVVRAGTSSTGLNNGICGSALTAQQAEVRRSTVDFVCDPPLTAKFVTVDIPLLRVTKQQICEVTVEQGTPGPCYE
ncbi:fibropellin-1-like isoform X2 [Patiria miniata]|uniref:Uncharacterized protein n=1 Tax=Patiria miniata TaxID=46514 RepID=A0A914APF2_PATMI|nr:fibropellin-1-like isoform X2 [Patiria miniata]